jgi:N-acetylmuramoyl-L-alanine amidase
MKILLMAGHGAGDPGALGNGYKEADLVREIVPILRDKLTPYADVTVFDMSKNPYKFLKSNSFNFKEYDYVLEVHFNAFKKEAVSNGKTKGVEILVHPTEKGVGVETAILNNLMKLGFTNRGIKRPTDLQNMNICKGKQSVSYALIETCFIDDIDDMALYNAKKEAVIDGIAQGIVTGFGLVKTAQNENKELETVSEIVSYLSEVGIITDVDLWLRKLEEDKNSYWLARKTANYIKNH